MGLTRRGGIGVPHNNLTGRNALDGHPITAITNLSTTLSGISSDITTINGDITTINGEIGTINGEIATLSVDKNVDGGNFNATITRTIDGGVF